MKAIIFLLFGILLMSCNGDISTKKDAIEEPGMFKKRTATKYVIFSPMEGVLMQNGQPLSKAKIIRRLKWNGNDEGLVEEFYTDDQGRFSLPVHEEELSLGMLDQFVGKADIEFEIDTGKDYLWSSSKFFPEIYTESGGQMSNLVCDLDFEEIAVPMGATSILTKCRWHNMPK
jgi:hypothetical protein